MDILLCLNDLQYKAYDKFIEQVPELEYDKFNYSEIITQIFITLSNNTTDFLKISNTIPSMDRLVLQDNLNTPDFFYRLKKATQELCLAIFFLCYELGFINNGSFDYILVHVKNNLVVLQHFEL